MLKGLLCELIGHKYHLLYSRNKFKPNGLYTTDYHKCARCRKESETTNVS